MATVARAVRCGATPIRAAWAGLVLGALLAGCAATRPPPRPAPPAGPLPRVALLPLEDLSGRPEAGLAFGRILFVELVRTGACQVIEAGVVEAAAESLGLRAPGSLAEEEVKALGQRLGAGYLMLGSLLESGTVRVAGGEVPSVGVTLKLLEAGSARVVWAAARFRTGEDRETVFGWGRQPDRQKLAAELAAEVLRDLRIPAAGGAPATPSPSDTTAPGARDHPGTAASGRPGDGPEATGPGIPPPDSTADARAPR